MMRGGETREVEGRRSERWRKRNNNVGGDPKRGKRKIRPQPNCRWRLGAGAGGWQSASHAAIKPVLSNGTAQTEAGANLLWCFTSRWRQPQLVHALFFLSPSLVE
ncbi:proline-rich receptor-like protein kinase perk2 isoform x2 [Plakobranchus ocellatus]|uniref:Proline-rich receptor-like protein kinase perk2 isoform x2 n=1 Tax=Plakobranchus ocellatus TaxID=259542 RepID=A0AAV4BRG6_9GAST|nr:proline-rich receptor-like protein kinase perk2 isoform x2 [Plakobranchus ocellatus]